MVRPLPSSSVDMFRALLMVGLVGVVSAGVATAQDLRKDDIVQQLTPRPLTRSLAPARTRRIEVVPGRQDEVLSDTQGLPSVAIRVLFDFDSDVVGPASEAGLRPLGEALQDPKLAGSRMLIGGHTDARGADEYNQNLSERRARSVREYLITRYRISPDRLVSMGFGRRKPADPADPSSGVNRRVEVVNLGG